MPGPAPTKSVDVRDGLVEALRLDLVGPDNHHAFANELLPESPGSWYLTGFLVPTRASLHPCKLTLPSCGALLDGEGETELTILNGIAVGDSLAVFLHGVDRKTSELPQIENRALHRLSEVRNIVQRRQRHADESAFPIRLKRKRCRDSRCTSFRMRA